MNGEINALASWLADQVLTVRRLPNAAPHCKKVRNNNSHSNNNIRNNRNNNNTNK